MRNIIARNILFLLVSVLALTAAAAAVRRQNVAIRLAPVAVTPQLAIPYDDRIPVIRFVKDPEMATPVQARDLAGNAVSSANWSGKVVILNFWATWCPPCVEETPSLNSLQAQIAAQGGVVLGISLDDDASLYEQFLKDNHVAFPTYRDTTKKIAVDYGTRMYPETYLIDRQGKIARKIIGGQAWDEGDMLLYVQSLLIQK
jgi:cytochrome c biogenesis protein CcmG, thiol:disulfide interchange protein DsbE